ncbi:MAG: FKBP-type peptidyl-prolyl cis-trans isomerase, partial [Clostridia bacterium]|nr:FKBP-type peptidyl-prolyl cis-trans isomerase [Clostridia bacterium]
MLSALLVFLCACSDSGKDEGTKTLIYGDTDLSEYVKLGEYKGVSIDTSSDEYKSAYKALVEKDISNSGIVGKKLEGKVEEGDVVNIDYEGKRDGVAFQGGTAQGHDLTIGSGQFIPGFEDGLIGVSIGDTVDLNLTFPKDYKSADLAGADVVFTVKVNYVKDSGAVKIEDHYSELGFNSLKEYEDNARERTIRNLVFEKVLESSEISDCPERDKKIFVNAVYEYRDNRSRSTYNVDYETILKQQNMTKEDFINYLSESATAQMQDQMVYYSILKAENLEPEYELTASEKLGQDVLDEITKVEKVVKDFLYNNA